MVLCLSGPESEREFRGPISDHGDRLDCETAREYLVRSIANPLKAAAELVRYRDAAQRLVRSAWAQDRIRLVADALLRQGALNGEEIAWLTHSVVC